MELADRVLVMNQGRIEQIGTPDVVFHHPQTEFVMNFLGQVNVFHGRLENGKVHFASMAVDPPDPVRVEDQPVRVFVRPHDFEVQPERNGHPCFRAVVQRIHSAGPNVRLDLLADSGEPLHAEMPQDRFRSLGITVDSQVFVTPKEVKVFTDQG
jgi:sulfate transport system ATP-binding protein